MLPYPACFLRPLSLLETSNLREIRHSLEATRATDCVLPGIESSALLGGSGHGGYVSLHRWLLARREHRLCGASQCVIRGGDLHWEGGNTERADNGTGRQGLSHHPVQVEGETLHEEEGKKKRDGVHGRGVHGEVELRAVTRSSTRI